MSRIFGPMRQVGYVVRDIEKAMKFWVEQASVGPWFYSPATKFTSVCYMGRDITHIDLEFAFANSGDIQIELIAQRCDTPSIYREFLDAGHDGAHHWSSWPENYDAHYDRARELGYEPVHEGDHPRGRFVYFRPQLGTGTIIEMSHMTSGRREFFDMVREAAIDWDGSDPIRQYAPNR